jgi:hypothetical protein
MAIQAISIPKEPPLEEKASATVSGVVEKIITSPDPREPEQAEIVIENGEPLYREIRIENKLQNEAGEEVQLRPGAPVDVTVEADAKDTVKKKETER